jgi:hypothetical protein
MLFTVSGVRAFSFALVLPFISAGTQYRMPALKAGKKQQVFMPAEYVLLLQSLLPQTACTARRVLHPVGV